MMAFLGAELQGAWTSRGNNLECEIVGCLNEVAVAGQRGQVQDEGWVIVIVKWHRQQKRWDERIATSRLTGAAVIFPHLRNWR